MDVWNGFTPRLDIMDRVGRFQLLACLGRRLLAVYMLELSIVGQEALSRMCKERSDE